MWLSTRKIFRADEARWADYIQWMGLPPVQEIRSIDSWLNRYVADGGDIEFESWAELDEVLGYLPKPEAGQEYYQLVVNALTESLPADTQRFKLLGHDLSDRTFTSSLLNCGRWEQETLFPIAQRVNGCGLLSLEDARLAQRLLPAAWHNDPHSFVSVWAVYEVIS